VGDFSNPPRIENGGGGGKIESEIAREGKGKRGTPGAGSGGGPVGHRKTNYLSKKKSGVGGGPLTNPAGKKEGKPIPTR